MKPLRDLGGSAAHGLAQEQQGMQSVLGAGAPAVSRADVLFLTHLRKGWQLTCPRRTQKDGREWSGCCAQFLLPS